MNVLLLSMPDSFEHMPALTMRMPNGALTSLAGNVDPHHRIAVADLILAQDRVRETVERLVNELNPDLVGLSIMTFQRNTARKIIELVRSKKPGVRVVVGGYDPSLAPEAYSDGPGAADFIVRGEGEITFRELLRAVDAGDCYEQVAGAASLYFWSAVSWGEWALARDMFAAARQGAGGRIRDLGQTVVDLDPELEEGGGYRILGRLHDQSPRIPFFTGWVSRREALSDLRKALAIGSRNSVNQFFLAEAIVHHEPANREEARRLFTLCASSRPRDEYRVEDAHYAGLSRQRLMELR